MLHVQRWLQRSPHFILLKPNRVYQTLTNGSQNTDSCGIPIQPTWSVNKLLSSYPKPTLSSTTLIRLHELSALTPPPEGTAEHATMKQEMEELIRLVEAVRLVDTSNHTPSHGGQEKDLNCQTSHDIRLESDTAGRHLLPHASRTSDGFYVVDSDKKQ